MGLGTLLETTAKLHFENVVPSDITFECALSTLQDHHFFISLDPHLVSYESLPSDPSTPDTKHYHVKDKMENIPKIIWSQDVESDLAYTNLPNGIRTHIKGPLGLVIDTYYTLEKNKDGELVIIKDVEITASRLMMTSVKGSCEGNQKDAHEKFVEIVRERQKGGKKVEGKQIDGPVLAAGGAPILA